MATKQYKASGAKRKAMLAYYKKNRVAILAQRKKKREADKNTIGKESMLSKPEATAIYNKKYRAKKKHLQTTKNKRKQYKTEWARKKNYKAKQKVIEQFNKDFESRYGK